jgi:hypothetical protein
LNSESRDVGFEEQPQNPEGAQEEIAESDSSMSMHEHREGDSSDEEDPRDDKIGGNML